MNKFSCFFYELITLHAVNVDHRFGEHVKKGMRREYFRLFTKNRPRADGASGNIASCCNYDGYRLLD